MILTRRRLASHHIDADLKDADHEIFRLRDEVLSSEGENVTFYGMAPTARGDETLKAHEH